MSNSSVKDHGITTHPGHKIKMAVAVHVPLSSHHINVNGYPNCIGSHFPDPFNTQLFTAL
jgi:5-enolpyruvylshikimate-3-phosphate synthase